MPISSEAIDMLRKKNLVEGRKPNVFVAKDIAQSTGKEVEYIHEKGFSDRNYRDMIMDALKEHKELSKEKLNALMFPVFPTILSEEQKKRKLTNMLHYLRSKGNIIYDNRKRVWKYVSSSV